MILNVIIKKAGETFMNFIEMLIKEVDFNPIETATLLIILALFIWLYKEFRIQHEKDEVSKTAKRDKLIIEISESLSISHQYHIGEATSNEFYNAIFNCFPYWNSDYIKRIRLLLNNKKKEENEKFNEITDMLYEELCYLNNSSNKEFNTIKSGMEFLEFIFGKLKRFIIPFIQSILVLYAILFLITYFFLDGDFYVKLIKLIALISTFLIALGVLDDYRINAIKDIKSIICIVITFISLLFIVVASNPIVIYIALLIFILSFAYYWKLKNNRLK